MNRFAKIKDIAVLNKETFKKNSFPNIIKYLDTGSLTKNKIEGFQLLNTKSDIIPSRAQRKVFTNTIIYSTVRPNQEHYGIIERDFKDIVVSTGFTTIDITDENIFPKFIYYLLTQKNITDYLHTIGMNAVSSYPSISPDDIGNLKFRLPDLPTQKSISKVLSDLDAKIELNNKINQELEAMAKMLYDYWFVQFDFPNEQGKPYKSSGGKMVYNKELKREIPESWEVTRLSNIANITTGKLDSNAEVEDGKYYFFTCAANPVRTDSFAFDGSVILIAGNNASGNFHINRYTGKFNAYQRTYIVTENKAYYLDYLYQVLERQLKVLKTRGQGSQTKFLTIGMLTEIPVFQTSTSVMENFHKIANPLYLRQLNVLNENQKLTELRNWLLPMLMNGQVTVKEAEEKLNMAAEPSGEYKIKGDG